jgi:hypothetical protein
MQKLELNQNYKKSHFFFQTCISLFINYFFTCPRKGRERGDLNL